MRRKQPFFNFDVIGVWIIIILVTYFLWKHLIELILGHLQ
jgi:hypothetical protein|tara:strand:+ start:891 stop:1010 length:120 start_codon:yes stop_codon:yes gene_type:complete